MSVIVHGRASSSNVQAVMWCAAELGLDVERRDMGGKFGGTGTPEFRAMNPMGRVPVLEAGDQVMFESAAILRHLTTVHPRAGFAVTARADMWAEWAKWTLCSAFLGPVFWGYYRTPDADRDMDKVIAALRNYEALWALVLAERGQRDWIAEDRISLADIWAGHLLYRYFTLDLPRQAPQGVADYYQMLTQRDAFRTHVMIDYSELKGRLSF